MAEGKKNEASTEVFNGLSKLARKNLDHLGLTRSEQFTCNGCMDVKECPYAFDAYSTDGDCLMDK
jgi:hypothetical protein